MQTFKSVLGLGIAVLLTSVEALQFSNETDITTTIKSTQKVTVTSTIPRPSATKPPSNNGTGDCCFVVQDTVSQVWWQISTTSVNYNIVNLTSITTYVTPYPTTTLSAITTNVYTTNASYTFTNQIGNNPIYLYANLKGGTVTETATAINGSQTVTAGVTVNSPAAFNVLPTFKVIHVPAITDKDGNVACATRSSFPTTFVDVSRSTTSVPYTTAYDTRTSTQIFYTTSGSGLLSAIGTVTTTLTDTYTRSEASVSTGGQFTGTYTNIPIFTVNPSAEAYFDESASFKPTGTVYSLATPFIYLPSRGATGKTGEALDGCTQGAGPENYGYPPQAAIEHAQTQFPELAGCLPAGPAIISNTECSQAAPATQQAGGDLTSSTVITVTPTLPPALPVTNPTLAPAPTTTQAPPANTPTTEAPPPANTPTTQAPPADIPTTQAPPPNTPTTEAPPPPANTPTTQAPPPANTPPTQGPPPANTPPTEAPPANNPPTQAPPPANTPTTEGPPPANTPTTQVGGGGGVGNTPTTQAPAPPANTPTAGVPPPANNPPNTPPANTPGTNPPANNPPATVAPPASTLVDTPPAQNPPANTPGTGAPISQNPPPQNTPASPNPTAPVPVFQPTIVNPSPVPSPNPIASAIASQLGVSPLPNPASPVVVSGIATIPVVAGSSALTGLTTVVSGTTNVLVSYQTTISTVPAPEGAAPTVITASFLPPPSPLPGTPTSVAGTAAVVVGSVGGTTMVPIDTAQLPALTGMTTVVGTSTYVMVTGVTTVAVVTPSPSPVVGGGGGGGSENGGSDGSGGNATGTDAPLLTNAASELRIPGALLSLLGVFMFLL